jgi:hypothetical protein
MLLKNSYGCTVAPNPKFIDPSWEGQFRGSSLDREKQDKQKKLKPEKISEIENENIETVKKVKPFISRTLSARTKSKIRKKLYSFFGQFKKLTFLTLTFVNQVEDKLAVQILGKFLENIKKTDADFEYLWVAEKQTKNATFNDNIHFHVINNKFWRIERYWKYWLELQAKHGIIPRDKNFNPSSAFDIKGIVSKNVKGISCYLTKYITKNKSQFNCQPWNCSKLVSKLYTDFYTGHSFLHQLERLEANMEIEIKRIAAEYCNLFFYPINRTTNRFYDGIHTKNKELWKRK